MSEVGELANSLFTELTTDADFTVVIPDFSADEFNAPVFGTGGIDADIDKLDLSDLTTGTLDGTGAFDKLMVASKAHLLREYEQNRISGAEYTKAYIALIEFGMANATQFLLSRDQSYWAAINSQIASQLARVQLVTARVELEKAKTSLQVLKIDALNASVTYAINKLRLASEQLQYDTAAYNLEFILPQQLLLAEKSVERTDAEIVALSKDNELKDKQILLAQGEVELIPAKADLLSKQITGQQNENSYKLKQIDLAQTEIALGPDKLLMLKKQVLYQEGQTAYLTKQGQLIQTEIDMAPIKTASMQEQLEAGRAQTLDTRTDGTPITGSVGAQKLLYAQQVISYRRDAEIKAAKMFADAFITMKTIDEGLTPPTAFANTNLDAILTSIKVNNNL